MRQRAFPPRIAQMILNSYGRGLTSAQITDKINRSKTAQKLGVRFTMPSVRAAVANITRGATIRV